MRRLLRLVRDDRGQALTEYVVVIPVVLFLFFAMVETLVIAQASQQANYAAFAAARSYATSYSKFKRQYNSADRAKEEAEDRAENAALLLMAPVSHAQVGEGLMIWNPIRNAMENAGQTVYEFYGLAEGFAVAKLYRMKDFKTYPPSNDENPSSVVKVTFDYMVPLTIPGFAELWDYLYHHTPGGGKTALHEFDVNLPGMDPSELNSALNTVLDALVALEGIFGDGSFGGFKSDIENTVSDVYDIGFLGALHNVKISAKSVCGFEPWSGNVRTDDIDPYCEGEVDEDMEACADAAQANQEKAEIMAQECEEADEAKRAYDERVTEYNQAVADYNACANQPGVTNAPVQCAPEYDAMQAAEVAKDQAYQHAEEQQEECEEAGEEVDETREQMEANCPS